MLLTSSPAKLAGSVRIPASKSHTVRGVLFATLAAGESVLRSPLDSGDTRSALEAARQLGATVTREENLWRITGTGGKPKACGQMIDVGNSGTTLYIALATAALADGVINFDGDAQIRKRTAKNLLNALAELGAVVTSAGNSCCPISVRGPLKGGEASIECQSSQYLTALLMNLPLAQNDSTVRVPVLFEQPYVGITLKWLEELGLKVDYAPDYSVFRIPGRQKISAFDKEMAADFSSATFFLCAAAITGSELLVQGLDMQDPQGDKAVVGYLRQMGAVIEETEAGLLVRKGKGLRGAQLDLNATPDALPAMAVTAAAAEGKTVLGNVPQARMKETDRIAVMTAELKKLGVNITENPDGLVVEGGTIRGGKVCGHGDHRVVMAFAVAGLAAEEAITVDTAEAAAITFPNFAELLASVGGKVEVGE
jgi:3-phosphoshikimate 1-carboxyvinyltransferase